MRLYYCTVNDTTELALVVPLVPVTVIAYVPGVVPLPPPVGMVLLVPPHPLTALNRKTRASIPISDCHLRRRIGKKKNRRTAARVSPPAAKRCVKEERDAAVVAAVVLMVSVAVAGCAPAIEAV